MYNKKTFNSSPDAATLPATSYPNTVGGMCYAVIEAHIDRVKSTH